MRAQQILSDGWYIKQLDSDTPDVAVLMREVAVPDDTWLAARMPAQVHDVLLAHGRISDPHVSMNAADSAWVGERDWAYACRFASPDRRGRPVLLRFGGLDTLVAAYLNGVHIGRFANMFRTYQLDVRDQLKPPGEPNILLLIFSSALRFVQNVEQPPEHVSRLVPYKYLRKAANDFTTYLGARPHFVKVGVYRDVALDLPDRAWIENICVRCALAPDLARATVHVAVETGGAEALLGWTLVDPAGQDVARGTAASAEGGFRIDVDQPHLWWPWTHGTPHLYQLQVTLGVAGEVVDSQSLQVGVRNVQVALRDPATGESRFQFTINGQPIFLRGANWVPVEGMSHCWQQDRALRLLDLAQHGQMNILRVWGGGYVPPAAFYEECDRRGMLIWQDFMFEYGMHPTGTAAFDATCRAEVEDVVRALRNHSCILLWAGGNENYMGWDFDFGDAPAVGRALFEDIIPEVCARLDPTRYYHPSSPYGGPAPNWPLEGDWHDYTWRYYSHGSAIPLFVSENGAASAPPLSSMRRFLTEDELWPAGHDPTIRTPGQPAWPPLWQYRSVNDAWEKVGPVTEFCDPASAADLVRVLGTAHGEYLQRNVERYRRGVPAGSSAAGRRCWGNMIWRLNDAWPILYFSVVDYYLTPKIAYYFLRRAYAPVLVCFDRTPDSLAVWVVNDSPQPVTGVLQLRRLDLDGTVRGEVAVEVTVAAGESRRCLETVDLGPLVLRHECLAATFAGSVVTHLLIGERYLHLLPAHLQVVPTGDGRIELTTDVFARQVALEIPGRPDTLFEDNYFDMAPGQRRTIAVWGEPRDVRVQALNQELTRSYFL